MALQRLSEVEEKQEEQQTTLRAELPTDAIYEILSRVPLLALQSRCRSVCKDWYNLSYEWNFRKLHCQRTKTISGYFIQTMKHNTYYNTFVSNMAADNHSTFTTPTLDFLPSKSLKIEACSSHLGLLCCTTTGSLIPQYYICKPSTKEWKKIRNPRTSYWTEVIAMVVKKSEPLHYKLLRLSRQVTVNGRYQSHCEIFDSKFGKWKHLNGIQLPRFVMGLGVGQSVSIDRAVHWLTMERKFIVAFDMDGESWRTIALPRRMVKSGSGSGGRKVLVEYNGKLGVLYSEDNEVMEVWVMEDYVKEKWVKKDGISLAGRFHDELSFVVPKDLYNAGVVLMKSYGQVMWYDYQRNTCVAVKEVHPFGSCIEEVFCFESDLVPCNLGE